MARSATFYISSLASGSAQISGQAHAGLECDRDAGQPFYVTWNGTIRGADWGPSQNRVSKLPGIVSLMNIPAHMQIGFDTIYSMDPATGVYGNRANPCSFYGANALTADTDYRDRATGAPRPRLSVKIPVRAPGGVACEADDNLFGLDVDAIWTWWFNILMLPPNDPRRQYCKISTMDSAAVNCCGMVGLGLREGGLGSYASEPTNIFYQGSASLLRWVNRAVARINELNDQRRTIMASSDYRTLQSITEGEQAADFHCYSDLPSLDAWKKLSAVQEGLRTGFARRKDQVAEIDRLLPLYHEARRAAKAASAAAGGAPAASDDWMSLLTQIHDQCFQHLIQKPTSDRRRAMIMLAKTIHDAIYGFNWVIREAASPPSAACFGTVANYGWR